MLYVQADEMRDSEMLTLLMVWLFMQAGHVTESPVNWTMNAKQYETFVQAPTARDCAYWGSAEMGKKCAGFLVFNSSPKNLRCSTDAKYKNVVLCTWDRP